MGLSIECGDIKRSKRDAFFIYCLEAWLLAYATALIDGSADNCGRSISDRLITFGDTLKILQSKMSRMRGSDLCVGQQYSIGACVKGNDQGMFESFSRILPHWAQPATSTWSEVRAAQKPAQVDNGDKLL